MLRRNITATSLFRDDIQIIKFQGEDTEVISNQAFVKGIESLNINELSESEIDSVVKILQKPSLNDLIRMIDLRDILSNFGVNEFDTNQESNTLEDDREASNDDSKRKKKAKLNFDDLIQESLNLLAVFTDYLLDTDTSVYEFFDEIIYSQVVRTKNKQNTVEIISSTDFFKRIQEDESVMRLIRQNKMATMGEEGDISEEAMQNI